MDINLEKIDTIRERTGASYKKAKEVLEKADGDVLDAIILLEEEEEAEVEEQIVDSKWTKNMGMAGNEIIEKLKRVIEKGNVTKVILKKDDEVLLNIPVTAGALGVILAPIASLLGISAALATRTKIEIVRNDGKVMDLNEMAEERVGEFKDMFAKNDMEDPTGQDIDDILDDIDQGADF